MGVNPLPVGRSLSRKIADCLSTETENSMVVLRRERRFYVMISIIVCAFFLYWWILKEHPENRRPKGSSRGGQ